MKVIWILAIYAFTSSAAAQEIEITKSENTDLVKFANSAEKIATTNAAKDILANIFILHNEPGTAGFDTGEVTHNIFIAVSEYDEYPLQNLFKISEFLNPKFIKWVKVSNSQIIAIIEYGVYNKREKIKIRISINDITIEKQNL